MKHLVLGLILIALPIVTIGGFIFLSLRLADSVQAQGDWEVDLMRIVCLFTMFLLATPSVYKAFKNASTLSPATSGE